MVTQPSCFCDFIPLYTWSPKRGELMSSSISHPGAAYVPPKLRTDLIVQLWRSLTRSGRLLKLLALAVAEPDSDLLLNRLEDRAHAALDRTVGDPAKPVTGVIPRCLLYCAFQRLRRMQIDAAERSLNQPILDEVPVACAMRHIARLLTGQASNDRHPPDVLRAAFSAILWLSTPTKEGENGQTNPLLKELAEAQREPWCEALPVVGNLVRVLHAVVKSAASRDPLIGEHGQLPSWLNWVVLRTQLVEKQGYEAREAAVSTSDPAVAIATLLRIWDAVYSIQSHKETLLTSEWPTVEMERLGVCVASAIEHDLLLLGDLVAARDSLKKHEAEKARKTLNDLVSVVKAASPLTRLFWEPATQYWLGVSEAACGEDRVACMALKSVLSSVACSDASGQLALIELKNKRIKDASAWLEQAHRPVPGWLYAKALLYERTGKTAQAEQILASFDKHCASYDGVYQQARQTLSAAIAERAGKQDRAMAGYSQVAMAWPTNGIAVARVTRLQVLRAFNEVIDNDRNASFEYPAEEVDPVLKRALPTWYYEYRTLARMLTADPTMIDPGYVMPSETAASQNDLLSPWHLLLAVRLYRAGEYIRLPSLFRRALNPTGIEGWKASGGPKRWVIEHEGTWEHDEWLELLLTLKHTEFWPMREVDIGQALEQARAEWYDRQGPNERRDKDDDPEPESWQLSSYVRSVLAKAEAAGFPAGHVRMARVFLLWDMLRFAWCSVSFGSIAPSNDARSESREFLRIEGQALALQARENASDDSGTWTRLAEAVAARLVSEDEATPRPDNEDTLITSIFSDDELIDIEQRVSALLSLFDCAVTDLSGDQLQLYEACIRQGAADWEGFVERAGRFVEALGQQPIADSQLWTAWAQAAMKLNDFESVVEADLPEHLASMADSGVSAMTVAALSRAAIHRLKANDARNALRFVREAQSVVEATAVEVS